LPPTSSHPAKHSSITYRYHEQTKHSYASVRIAARPLDWSNKPYPFKYYVSGEKIILPRGPAKPSADTLESLTCSRVGKARRALSMEDVATLLFFTGGVSRIKRYGRYVIPFRVTPATGALHSTEIYMAARGVEGLPEGLYHFDPGEFLLTTLRKGVYHGLIAEAVADEAVAKAQLIILLTSVGWRNAWKYGERSYRHWFWDGGAVVANAASVACAMGLEYRVYSGFADEAICKLLAIDGISEAPIALLTLGEHEPAEYTEPHKNLSVEVMAKAAPLLWKPAVLRLIEETHRATTLASPQNVERWRESVASVERRKSFIRGEPIPSPPPVARSLPLGETILIRGSTRRFARRDVGANQLYTILLHGFGPLYCDFLASPDYTLLYPFLIINSVDGLPSGAYRYDPQERRLYLLRKGEFREVAYYLCLEQELARDASAVIFIMMDLEEVFRKCGERGYRAAQLEGGIRLGRIYLAAYSLGLGATGLTFYDDDCVEFFAPASEGLEMSTTVALGHPAYKARPGEVYTPALKHPALTL